MTLQTPLHVPPPVDIVELKHHFKTTYQLGESQVELMIQSSRKSINKILAEAELALQAEDACIQLANVGHSLKGLLLNMGEVRWADVARDMEASARAGEKRDYAAVITMLSNGMAAVIAYSDES